MQNIQFALLNGDVSVNWGSILGNAVAQQLLANGFPLRYFNSVRHGEVDFVVEKNGKVLPVEVKSRVSFKLHAPLNNVLVVKDWRITETVVLCQGNQDTDESVLYLPWYMVRFLKADELPRQWLHWVDIRTLAV